MLSSDVSLSAMVETTAVQSLHVSLAARVSRAEVKRKTFMTGLVKMFWHHLGILYHQGEDTFIARIGSLTRSTSKYMSYHKILHMSLSL